MIGPTTTILDQIVGLQRYHNKTWRNKRQWRWVLGLIEEVVELIASLVGLHEGPPEWELMQIASICLNWLEYRQELSRSRRRCRGSRRWKRR